MEESKEPEPVFKVEVPANRVDLLCVEGIAEAIRSYLDLSKPPQYTLAETANPITVTIQAETADVRKYVIAAVLRDIEFTQETYNSFIELQDHLHMNLCRRRTLASMGTHDLDKVKGNITYEALAPEDITFKALKQPEEMNAKKLFEVLHTDLKLKPYLGIIENKPKYPVFYDEDRKVLSLPPIINSDATKISPETKNCFIEVTATDHNRAKMVLDILVTTFSVYCKNKFTVEPVEIISPDGSKTITPSLEYKDFDCSLDYCNTILGLHIPMSDIPALLVKMGLSPKEIRDSDFTVTVPPTRPDILHACDLAEDIGVAFGFNNIP